jgi:hypothetical protein
MHTHEIARPDWRSAFDELTLSHDGWLVSVEILSPAMGAQPEVIELPLTGIWVDAHDHAPTIAITMEGQDHSHITHVIDDPVRVFVERTEEEADAALEVEAADGTKTIVRFRVPAKPETVDGVVRSRVA